MNFNHPVYVNYFKFLLIEEIVLADNIAEVHYGKCNVIGYLAGPDCIQSLAIPNVERYKNLLTRTFKLLILLILDNINFLMVL